jgi:hypothetical protein
MFGFRARNVQHSSLASGRILFSSCGADPSRAKMGLSAPKLMSAEMHWKGPMPTKDTKHQYQKRRLYTSVDESAEPWVSSVACRF